MRRRAMLLLTIALGIGGCGSDERAERADQGGERPPRRETVFDPMTSTIGRAQGVQQTVNEQAAEQRRRIEESER